MGIFRLIIAFTISLLSCLTIEAVTVPYIPQVTNYTVNQYEAGNQNWAAAQANDGKMYFGNNRGLLQFDGVRWNLYKLPNNLAVRSVFIDDDGRIYVGSFEEFGYFEQDNKNQLIYHSLKEQVTGYKFFNDEIWTIQKYKGKLYFQSFSSYFIYDGKEIRKGTGTQKPLYFFLVNGDLYVQFIGEGFCKATGEDSFTELASHSQLNNDHVVAALPYGDKLLLVTSKHGFYMYDDGKLSTWDTPANSILKSGIANRAVSLKDSSYIVGTISEGLVAIDRTGHILWHINKANQLINNTVLGIFVDSSDNLWVTMDNGISHIQVNSPIYFYESNEVQVGMVHDMAIYNDNIYLATNQGVYVLSNAGKHPYLIPGTEEQSWFITDIDNQLIVGHNRGTLLIEDKKAIPAPDPSGGGTALRKCTLHGEEVLLQVSYNYLSIFKWHPAEGWKFSHNVEGFNNLLRTFEVDPSGTIWASHMYKGMYRIRLDENLQKQKEIEYIGRLNPAKKEGTINVMKLRGRIVFSDGDKFYTYEDISSRIVPYDLLNRDFPELSDTYRIVPCNNDLFWFIRNTEYVLLSYDHGAFHTRLRIPFSMFDDPTIEDRGNIYVDTDGISYFCLNGGFAKYNPKHALPDKKTIALTLSSVEIHNRHNSGSHLLPCSVSDTPVRFDYQYNNISFKFSYPDYRERFSHILYKLEGFDDEWTEGSPNFSKSYSNLPYGKYIMHAVIKDNAGADLSTCSYPFTVKHPFYRSAVAFIIYFFLLAGIIFLLVKMYINWEIARKDKQAEQQRRRQAEQLKAQEQLITKLKNEKLEDELSYKSKELASATLSVISHNDFLEGLKKEIQEQQLSGNYTKRFFDKLVRKIDDSISKDDEWAVFQANFDRIHENFFVKLKERYPDLTPGDLRMCALLRLNMPTKDMASMQNLSVRGIEAARYRLRKKLNLPEGQSLVDFMIQFS